MILVKDLIWIDKIIDNSENQGYIKIMKEKYNINCVQFKDVEQAFQYMMNSLKFKVILLIIQRLQELGTKIFIKKINYQKKKKMIILIHL